MIESRVLRRGVVAATVATLAVFGSVTLPAVAAADPDEAKKDTHSEPAKPRPDDGQPDDGAPDDGAPGAGSVPADDRFASAEAATIRPGSLMVTGGAACTMNFVYTSGDAVFVGYAAHCAADGGASDVNGCEEFINPSPAGTPVTIQDDETIEGELAYSSWAAMQAAGLDPVADEDLCFNNDFALVEIDPADVSKINPSVPNFGGPEGLDSDGTESGETVFSFQPNMAAMHDAALMPNKQGMSLGSNATRTNHQVVTMPPGIQGDSGSGYLDGEGDAFGGLSTLLVDSTGPVSNGVADLATALSYANANGGIGELSLVQGTEPFSSNGLPMTEMPNLDLLNGIELSELTPVRP